MRLPKTTMGLLTAAMFLAFAASSAHPAGGVTCKASGNHSVQHTAPDGSKCEASADTGGKSKAIAKTDGLAEASSDTHGKSNAIATESGTAEASADSKGASTANASGSGTAEASADTDAQRRCDRCGHCEC